MDKSTFTYSEEYRHQCEVRFILNERRLRGKEWLRQFLNQKAVQPRRLRLEKDIWEQWSKGNKGEVPNLWL
jgi:hypothetical protein